METDPAIVRRITALEARPSGIGLRAIAAAAGTATRASLGLDTTDSPQFTAVNVGAATDTTVSRVSAGVIAVEGVTVLTTATGAPLPTLRTITGTSDTLVLTDAFKEVITTNGSAVSITVPPNADVAFPIGTLIGIEQGGAGAVTIVEGSGVTVDVHADDTLVLAGIHSNAVLKKKTTNTWTLSGKLV